MLLGAARRLRATQTDVEKLLWRHLRAHRLQGHKFKRQQPIGIYIVDFVCFDQKLIIEVDGSQHMNSSADLQRDQWLNSQGYKVLRFWNNEVLQNIEGVLERILDDLSPSPQPLSHKGRGASDTSNNRDGTQTSLSPRGRGTEGEGA
jgi:very-short-patch-repair endonuclease